MPLPGLALTTSARQALKWIGDENALQVLFALSETKRFGELNRDVPVTPKVLTRVLRGLEAAGLVTRKVHPVVPPRVDYSLTQRGRQLRAPVVKIVEWAATYDANS